MSFRDAGASGLTISSFRTTYAPTTNIPPARQSTATSHTAMNDTTDSKRIPLSHEPSGIYTVTESDLALTKRKFVKVSSVGEVEVSPDRVEFCIAIACAKPDVAAARGSVRKRYDFLMLALKKVGVKADGISSTSMVKRFKVGDEADENDDLLERKILREAEKQMNAFKGQTNNNDDEDPVLDSERIKVIKELYVVCGSLHQYMELFSIVSEVASILLKLSQSFGYTKRLPGYIDRQVNVSPPIIRVSPEYIQQKTQEAAKLAMDNAIQKANHLIQSQKMLRASVGKLFYSVEDSLTISDINEYQNISTSTAFESLKWKRNNKLIVCRLTSLFEVNTLKGYRGSFV